MYILLNKETNRNYCSKDLKPIADMVKKDVRTIKKRFKDNLPYETDQFLVAKVEFLKTKRGNPLF